MSARAADPAERRLLHLLPRTTPGAPHVRDAVSVRTLTNVTMLALLPSVVTAIHGTGQRASVAMATTGWRGAMLGALGVPSDPSNAGACALHGLALLLPLWVVTLAVGAGWQWLFARARGAPTAGLASTALLFSLALPPGIPLWQAAAGISFGIVIGQEVFGGAGKNFLHPALAGLAFLSVAYPASLRSAGLPAVAGVLPGGTPLDIAAAGGLAALHDASVTWADTFWGRAPGGLGDTSAAAALAGAAILLWVRAVSWRVLAGGVGGLVVTASIVAHVAPGLPVATLPWQWHLTLGGFAFGLVFLATDPVTAATTDPGRWCYGILIGVVTVLIRVANPAHPDGVLLAILLGNVFAPLMDYAVVWRNGRRRERRGA